MRGERPDGRGDHCHARSTPRPAGGGRDAPAVPPQARAGQTRGEGGAPRWVANTRRSYEVDPLGCSRCGGTMRIVVCITETKPKVIGTLLRPLQATGVGAGSLPSAASSSPQRTVTAPPPAPPDPLLPRATRAIRHAKFCPPPSPPGPPPSSYRPSSIRTRQIAPQHNVSCPTFPQRRRTDTFNSFLCLPIMPAVRRHIPRHHCIDGCQLAAEGAWYPMVRRTAATPSHASSGFW